MRVRSIVIAILAGASAVAVPAGAMDIGRPPRPRLGAVKPSPPAKVPPAADAEVPPAPPVATTPPSPAAAVATSNTPVTSTPPPTKPAAPAAMVSQKGTAPLPSPKLIAPAPPPAPEKQALRLTCMAGRPDGAPAVRCEWSRATGAVRYDLYRKTAETSPERIWAGTSTAFVDRTVVEGTGYGYGVKAIDAAGRVIGFGGVVGVRCCDGAAVRPAPEKQALHLACVAGAPDGAPAVRCEWSAAAGAVHYDLYRKTADGTPERIWSGTETAFVDRTVVEGMGYAYGVKAIDAAGRVIGFGGITTVRCCPSGAG